MSTVQKIGKVSLSLLALVFLLVYNFFHTGSLLASYMPPEYSWVGYLAAGGIELSVVALARQIGLRKNNAQDTTFFYIVLGMVVVVSALANAAMGFLAKYSEVPTIATILKLDWLEIIVWLAATALISFIVLSLAEILGQDLEASSNPTPGGIVKCSKCEFEAPWPTEKYKTERAANNALRGHKKAHNKKKPKVEEVSGEQYTRAKGN